MQEAALIERAATEHSLAIVDELGRGTSLREGRAVAFSFAERMAQRGTLCVFATHFDLRRLSTLYPQALRGEVRVDRVRNRHELIILGDDESSSSSTPPSSLAETHGSHFSAASSLALSEQGDGRDSDRTQSPPPMIGSFGIEHARRCCFPEHGK